MNRFKAIALIALVSAVSLCAVPQSQCATMSDKLDYSMVKSDEGIKTEIIADQAKIDQEREAIMAAGRRLQAARKTGDKLAAEQVRKEVEQEIKTRKDAIKNIKADIRKKEGGSGSFDTGGRRGKIKR